MKKFLQAVLAFTLVFTLVGAFGLNALAEEEETNEEVERKVVVHYHRWDGDYEGRTVWTWGAGEDGTNDNVNLVGVSDFGGMFEIHVAEDAGDELGLILRYGSGWGSGQDDRDGLLDPEDLAGEKVSRDIVIRDEDGEFTGFNEDGVKHVFVYEGSADVIYQDDIFGPFREGYGTLAVIYYDRNEDYAGKDFWHWNFGAGTDNSGSPLVAAIDVDGGIVGEEMFRVAHFSVGADAEDTAGIIYRDSGWATQTDDIDVDVSDIKGEGFKTIFVINETVYESWEEFEAVANEFEVIDSLLEDLFSFRIEFNKGVRVMFEDEDGNEVSVFDPEWFSVVDASGNDVELANVSFPQGDTSVSEFMIIFEDGLSQAAGPYTLVFQTDTMSETLEFEFEVPSVQPTITIVGAREVTLELGDNYSLPSFRAVETVGEDTMPLYNVRVKEGHGHLSTRDAGVYELVLEATDRYGNHTEEIITVTVIDPCDDTAHLNGLGGISNALLGVFIGLPLAVGAFFLMRRNA